MEKDFTNIEKKFVDQGWQNMQDMLDEVMPVTLPPKKRRLGFWWLFFGVLIGISFGAFGMYYFLNNEKPKESKEILIADKTEASNSENVECLDLVDTKISSDISYSIATDLEKGENLAIFSKPKNAKEKTRTTNNNNRKIVKSNEIDNKSKIETTIVTEEVPFNLESFIAENTTKIKEIEIGFEAASVPVEANDSQVMDNIEELGFANLKELEIPVIAETLKVKNNSFAKLKSRKWSIETGMIFNKNRDGWYAGGVYSEKIDNNLSWSIGLNYSQQNLLQDWEGVPISGSQVRPPQFDPSAFYFDNGFEILTESDLSGLAVNSAQHKVFVVPTTIKLQYLNIPVSLAYQLGSGWQINGGFTFSTLLLAPTDLTQGGIFNTGFDRDATEDLLMDQTFDELEENPSLSLLKLRKIDLAMHLNVSYALTDYMKIQAGYHHGRINFMKDTSVKNYNRFFKFGLQFQINR